VILATGSHWARDGLSWVTNAPIPGAHAAEAHVFTPEQIMVEGKPITADRVVVYDCEGYFMGVSLAERLALEGRSVTLITPFATPAPYMQWTEEHQMMIPRLHELEVEMVVGHAIDEISPEGARGHLIEYPAQERTWPAGAIVLATEGEIEIGPGDSFYFPPGRVYSVENVGDDEVFLIWSVIPSP
jgi:dimethylamine/trimethylamine dehydrogenase